MYFAPPPNLETWLGACGGGNKKLGVHYNHQRKTKNITFISGMGPEPPWATPLFKLLFIKNTKKIVGILEFAHR